MGIENVDHLKPGEHDEEDVPTVVETHTGDGPGFESEDQLPPSDLDEEEGTQ